MSERTRRWRCSNCSITAGTLALGATYESVNLLREHLRDTTCGGEEIQYEAFPVIMCPGCSAGLFGPHDFMAHRCAIGASGSPCMTVQTTRSADSEIIQQTGCRHFRLLCANPSVPLCSSCETATLGDTESCRFEGVRALAGERGNAQLSFTFSGQRCQMLLKPLPDALPVRQLHDDVLHLKRTVSNGLLGLLEEEKLHHARPNTVFRPFPLHERLLCDLCVTSIFTGAWMCTLCGADVCRGCYHELQDEAGNSKAQCHPFNAFRPVSYLDKSEVADAIRGMKSTISGGVQHSAEGARMEQLDALIQASTKRTPKSMRDLSPSAKITYGRKPKSSPGTQIGALPVLRVSIKDLTAELFEAVLRRGCPLVVVGLRDALHLDEWRPNFLRRDGIPTVCTVVDCERSVTETEPLPLEEFIQMLDGRRNSETSFKLKDFPRDQRFREAYPDRYEIFERALPLPGYTSDRGILNIASHYPTNSYQPDIGPKAYCALKSKSQGTTRLHMDMSDAINILVYADTSSRSAGTKPATWHIFPIDAAQKLRSYIRRQTEDVGGSHDVDPIHSGSHYLADLHLVELWTQERVASWQIEQDEGEAIFVPAGCAHQVRNNACCIKIAKDFISPSSISRCVKLTDEFRKENVDSPWKEDVLQLQTAMWFAWLACSQSPLPENYVADRI